MEKLAQEFHNLTGRSLTPHQIEAFESYQQELISWNQVHNLTAIRDPEQILVKHFLDSLSTCLVMDSLNQERVIDVGTGAGFPGLPLKILYPQIKLTLVESIGKKAAFCEHITEILGLKEVQVIRARVEEVGKQIEHREQYDWALARAVAVMPILLEYLLPLVKIGGRVLAMKGDSGPAESQNSENALQILGGHLHQLQALTLPGVVEDRYLVVFDKVAATPEKYPRRIGIPTKRPL